MAQLAKIQSLALVVAVSISPSDVFTSADMQIESLIVFGTACARCHEGECSGRLSFHLPKDAADQHIHRYGGTLSLETTRQLSELLRYMKEKCGYYPFSFALADDQVWGSDILATLKAPSKQAYFIPLGRLNPGVYKLSFGGLSGINKMRIEIMNAQFDYLENDSVHRDGGKTQMMFQTHERSDYFLRITAQHPINLTKLELVCH